VPVEATDKKAKSQAFAENKNAICVVSIYCRRSILAVSA
jgi:hypothetical protein